MVGESPGEKDRVGCSGARPEGMPFVWWEKGRGQKRCPEKSVSSDPVSIFRQKRQSARVGGLGEPTAEKGKGGSARRALATLPAREKARAQGLGGKIAVSLFAEDH